MCNFAPDIVFVNGNVITMSDKKPRVEAIAVKDGKIMALGSTAYVRSLVGNRTELVDFEGHSVVPGFIDAHNHVIMFGMGLRDLDLSSPPISKIDDICKAIASRAKETLPGKWIKGRGYDQNKLIDGRHPTRWDLDSAVSEHPVMITNTSRHMSVVNSKALEAASIDVNTPDPPGGKIVRDDSGTPTGLLQEKAQQLIFNVISKPAYDDIKASIVSACDQYLREGITSSQDAGIGMYRDDELRAFQEVVENREVPVRFWVMIGARSFIEQFRDSNELAGSPRFGLRLGIRTGFGNDLFRIGAVKFMADGSLIGRTAAVSEAFVGEPDNNGFFVTEPNELLETVKAAHMQGWQVSIHAIGDVAVQTCLDIFEKALAAYPRKNHRHRIEHCAILNEALLERIVKLGVVPVPQQHFISALGDGFIRSLGRERVRLTYPMKSFLKRGIPVPGSSDRPVINGAPLLGIHDVVNQKTESGDDYAPEEKVSVEEAIRMYTMGSAYAAFEERIKGSIAVGKLADFVALSENPASIDPTGIKDIEVVKTVIGGEVVFER